jgi:ribosome-associated toxin RatA of RatAB toxin-antitoxin module
MIASVTRGMKLHVYTAIALGCSVALGRAASAADDIRTWSEPPTAGAPTYVAEGVVAAPPAEVWVLVSKCADYVHNMPRIAASRELSREGDERTQSIAVCEVTADVPFPLSDLTSVTRATMTVDAANGSYTRAWTLLRGDYTVNDGSWRLVPVDGGAKTQVTYRIHVKPNVSLPDSLVAASQKTTLPQVIQYLRERTSERAAAAAAR